MGVIVTLLCGERSEERKGVRQTDRQKKINMEVCEVCDVKGQKLCSAV